MQLWVLLALLAVFVGLYLSPWSQRKHVVPTRNSKPDPKEFFINKQGLAIFHTESKVADEKARIYLVHGLSEHIGRYKEMTKRFNEIGFSVYGMDHQGHGRSDGGRIHVEAFEDYADDYIQYIDDTLPSDYKKPVFIFGHSLGGLIATRVLFRKQELFNAASLSGPAIIVHPSTASPVLTMAARVIAPLLPQLPVVPLNASAISRRPEVVEDYLADPLVHHGGLKPHASVQSIDAAAETQARLKEITIPIMVQVGMRDTLCDPNVGKFVHEHVSSTDKKVVEYPQALHEIFLEPEREEAYAALLGWFEAHL